MRLVRDAVAGVMLALCCLAAGASGQNLVRLLHGDLEAAQARADLINSAATSVETSYYWVGDDRVGAWYLSLLKSAALRGVRVRLMVDAEHNDIPPAVQEHLMACGVHIKEYHPHFTGHPGWQDRRMHDKTLIVDGRHLIVGSRNIREAHFGRARLNYVDRDMYCQGEVARQARRYFDCLWLCDQVRPTDLRPTVAQRLRLATSRRDPEVSPPSDKNLSAFAWLASGCGVTVCGQPIDCGANHDWSADACPACSVCFVYDPCGVKGQSNSIEEQLLRLFDRACASIVIETPYFVMSSDEKRVLGAAAARGVSITILTNSLASTDHTIVAAEFQNQQHWLLARQVQIWELAGPNHLHAKSAVVDGTIAFVGSYNFDPRSQSLNTETGIIVHDAPVAEWVLRSIGEHMSRSYPLGADGRSQVDGSRHPGAPLGRILGMQPLRILAPVIRGTL
jgi:cardiolipin synthase C